MPTSSSTPPAPPRVPTGQELFDMLMEHIEPELTSVGSKKLPQTYKDETPAEREKRLRRYDRAFQQYDKTYNDYMNTLDKQVDKYRQNAFAHAEMEDRKRDDDYLHSFDLYFAKAA
jgi:hypothetical protein